ncbi:RHS repeat-associated core domain-containing protein [Clostridium sp. BNL1100]|uniref:RHS repeat-associated core domain-containing protein n=1 Tax=Clostridium sp. BNL1100 TaxID=755731 RepID=UPI00024A7E2F|nr:RHS repeat-associated core domain-containing protein [Clostridium sp. BNL1100]AEY66721.1 RHS repeat-associated core domain protein [Clostridium sp. BNL1100]
MTQTDGNGNTTSYEYNAANKVIRKIDQGGRIGTPGKYTYLDAKTEKYTYFADGNMETKTDRNGKQTVYSYDIHGRLTRKAIGEAAISYTYDNNDNQLTITDKTGTTARTYDEENRVITKKAPGFGTTTYTYDNTEGGGLYFETAEDFKHNLTKKVYDKAGRLYEVISDGKTTTYEYYGNGSRKTVTYSDGAKEEYTYYKDGLNKTLTNKKADGTVIDTYSYTYDEAHNQTSKTDRKGTTSYNYDSLNGLEKVTEPNGRTTNYTFDKAGNRLTETILAGATSVTTIYTYNEQNRLVSTVKRSGTETITDTYRFDNNGNTVSKTKETVKPVATSTSGGFSLEKSGKSTASNVTYYKFDVWNQLIKTTAGKKTATYSYNGEGYRVSKTENERTTNYLYEADKVVLETDVEGNETARNIYGTNLLTRTAQNDTTNYMYNGHGDVTALVGENGAIQATYYYDAFGNITEQTGDVNNNITYAGYKYDKETDLYYLNARYYDSKTARFLSEDTYTGDENDPLSLNLYTYCANEPVMYVDPTGHASANINVGGIPVGNAQVNNGRSTGNLTDIVKGLGGTTKATTTNGVYTVTIPNADTGKDVKITLNTNTKAAYDLNGNKLFDVTITNNKTQVGVSQMAKIAGVNDTVSWWNGSNKQTNVVVQPDMNGAAIQVTRSGNNINIKAYVNFTGGSNDIFQKTNYTYAEVAAAGILDQWNKSFTGTYYDFGINNNVSVKTTIYSNDTSKNNLWEKAPSYQKNFLEIYIDNSNPTTIFGIKKKSHVPHMDGGQEKWSVSNKKKITMYRSWGGDPNEYGQKGYAHTVAHEFGHVLGIGDAYGDKDKGRTAAKNTLEVPIGNWLEDDIMSSNGKVNANDVEMVWEAWSSNKWQYFTDYK